MNKKEKDAIIVSQLNVSYGKSRILHDVSVAVPMHAILAIIGPNGSGKTTFLKTLLGVITLESGSIHILGMTPRDARQYVAYVPQRFAFDQTMPITVGEFLTFSVTHTTAKKREESLAHFDIDQYEHTQLGKLSGGQLQRVLLARAFLQQPKILYLDEPEAGIDIGGEKNFYEMVEHLHTEHNMTIILVSHEIDIVSKHATHVLCLNRRHICFGDPQTALKSENLRKLYGTDVTFFDHHKEK